MSDLRENCEHNCEQIYCLNSNDKSEKELLEVSFGPGLSSTSPINNKRRL